ncbi:MAG: radical SAM protein [Magnetococcales bacterium]|nr:radical SAM protein [Magnetococcales bacterium]
MHLWSLKSLSDSLLHHYGRARSAMPALLTRPLGFFFYITGRCNLDCNYCWQREDEQVADRKSGWVNSAARELPPAAWVAAVEKLPRPCFLGLSGGEATLAKSFPDIMAAATRRGIPTTVNTNAAALRPRQLEQMLAGSLRNLSISLDGFAEVHDSGRRIPGLFQRIVQTIETYNRLRQGRSGVHLTIKSVLTDANVEQMLAFRQYCATTLHAETLNISLAKTGNHAQFTLMHHEDARRVIQEKPASLYPYSNPEKVAMLLERLLHDNRSSPCRVTLYPWMPHPDRIRYFLKQSGESVYQPCYLARAMVSVLPDGTVIPCLSLGLGNLGNYHYDIVELLRDNQPYRQFLEKMRQAERTLPAACNVCCFSRVRRE